MSELRDTIRDVIADRQSATAELCQNLVTGGTFLAEIEEIQDTELNTELGRDAREQVLMHVLERQAASAIVQGQAVAVTLYGIPQKFKVLRRKGNPGDAQVEFGLMKIVQGVDT